MIGKWYNPTNMTDTKHTTKKADEILAGATDYASGEFANTDLSDERKEVFLKARTDRRIRITRDNAAEDYYKKHGRYCDYSDAGDETYIYIAVKVFIQLLIISAVNLILYLPVYYVVVPWWGGVSGHDALYVTLLVNTVIGAILSSLWSESDLKRKAFIAGMNAEASDRVVGEYHDASTKLHRQ